VEGLVDRGLCAERESGIDLSGDLAGDDLEDLLAELDEEVVKSRVDLLVDGATLGLGLGDRSVEEGSVLGLLRRGEDQGGVGGGILRLVLADGCWIVSILLSVEDSQTSAVVLGIGDY
jgi:hypothetical protein